MPQGGNSVSFLFDTKLSHAKEIIGVILPDLAT